jgi:ethanolamine utilization protein EutQ (cupin superfamily)
MSVMKEPNWLEMKSKKKSNNWSKNKVSMRNVATEWVEFHVRVSAQSPDIVTEGFGVVP